MTRDRRADDDIFHGCTLHAVGDLILHRLGLDTECYQPRCPSAKDDFPKPFLFNYTAPLRRIVDPETRLPSGYDTAIRRMIQEARDLGGRVFTHTKLVKFEIVEPVDADDEVGGEAIVRLSFENTETGTIRHLPGESSDPIDVLVLNLPRNRFFEVNGIRESLRPRVSDAVECIVFDAPAELFGEEIREEAESARHFTTNLGKAYLFYEDAFWRSKLHREDGTWPPDVGFAAVPTEEGVRLNVRWYDGPVVCEGEQVNGTASSCMGLLEIYYSVSNETFYSSLPKTPEDPLGSIWETDGPDALAVLRQAHAGLVSSLRPLLDSDGVDASTLKPPSGLIVGIWHRPTDEYPLGQGYTAPTKVLYYSTMSGAPDQACGVPGLTDESYRDTVLQPWRRGDGTDEKKVGGIKNRIFLVNNDFSCMDVRYYFGDWAEESLLQVERAMLLLGMSPPEWLQNENYYHNNVVKQVYLVHEDILPTPATSIENGRLKWSLLPIALVATIWGIVCLVKKRMQKKHHTEYTSIP
ncbi:hypothetical protein ACHAW5_003380 [Stephanodiscus triporus]|uniref:Amine oxidase n=1 Tax=Stephanodiscus triporus TaxID=2934178 RepID=A0ABD3NIA6_9STRA